MNDNQENVISVEDMKPDKVTLVCDNVIRLLVSGSISYAKAISDLQRLRHTVYNRMTSLGESQTDDLKESLQVIDRKIEKLMTMSKINN